MTENETPIKLCQKWGMMLPDCFDEIEAEREGYIKRHNVSDLCDTPISVAMDYLSNFLKTPRECAALASELTGLAIWRKRKIAYDFDDILARELADQANDLTVEDEIPIEILLHPPYPCVYIKTNVFSYPPNRNVKIGGVMSWIEEDVHTHVREFRIQLFTDDMEHTIPFVIELTQPTIQGCMLDTMRTSQRNMPGLLFDMSEPMDYSVRIGLIAMQLYLYVCSADADIRDNLEQKKIYRPREKGQPVKDKFRELEIKDVGVVIGATLRRAQREAAQHSSAEPHEHKQGSPRRPHTRRAHWHHYWIGSKSQPDERKLTLKWVHPILVGGYTDNVVTMIPVKE